MRSYLDRGYSVVKMKIGGASLSEDCKRIEAVLRLLGPGQKVGWRQPTSDLNLTFMPFRHSSPQGFAMTPSSAPHQPRLRR